MKPRECEEKAAGEAGRGGVGASNSLKSGDELCFTGAEWHGSI